MPDDREIRHFTRDEVDSIYVSDEDRFVVSLVAGYGKEGVVETPEQAAAAALRLTTGPEAQDTHWCVYDRMTGEMHHFKQSDFRRIRSK